MTAFDGGHLGCEIVLPDILVRFVQWDKKSMWRPESVVGPRYRDAEEESLVASAAFSSHYSDSVVNTLAFRWTVKADLFGFLSVQG